MDELIQNKLLVEPVKKLIWKLGLPMIISMVLQALYNVVDSIFVANMEQTGTLANEVLTYAFPIQILFALSNSSTVELIDVCTKAVRIASIGYVFMGFNVALQGVFQALRYSFKPLFTALLRLVVFVFAIAYFFTLSSNVMNLIWWTFPIAEILTTIASMFLLKDVMKKCINN